MVCNIVHLMKILNNTQRLQNYPKLPNRILVIRTDRMGDVILSTPVLTSLKQTFPHASIAILVRPYTRDLVQGHPDVDEIICIDETGHHKGISGLLILAKELKDKRFDVALVLHPTFRLALLTFLARIPLRVGTGYRAYSFLFNKRIYHHRKRSNRHEVDLNLEVSHAIGANIDAVEFKFYIPEEAINKLRKHLDFSTMAKRPLVVLQPGSGGSARDWPLHRFGELATQLVQQLNAHVIVTGIKSEKALVDKVQKTAEVEIQRVDGLLSIKELAALLQRADLVIANSTGPLHLAVAVGTEVIGLFCPIKPCLPQRWGPYKPGARTWQKDSVIMPPTPECDKCIDVSCQNWDCMEAISVLQVFDLAKKKLAKYFKFDNIESRNDKEE